MNNIFLDSNICVYAFDKTNTQKQPKAFELLANTPNISSQVIIETYNACNKKLKIAQDVCDEMTHHLLAITKVCNIDDGVFTKALVIKNKYKISFLDSLIIATALLNNCSILYSEDLHHNLIIENQLAIINPFI